MRIACPTCDAVYEVPEALLGAAHRTLRCARCGHEWVPQEAAPRTDEPPPVHAAPHPPNLGAPSLGASLAPSSLDPPSLAERATETPPLTEPPRVKLTRVPATRPPAASHTASGVPVAPPPPPDTGLTVFPPLVGRTAEHPGRGVLAAGWTATALLLIVIAAAAYIWRADVQAAWPPSQRAYAALGLR